MGQDLMKTPSQVKDVALYIINGIKSSAPDLKAENIEQFLKSLNRCDLEVFAACCLMVTYNASKMEPVK